MIKEIKGSEALVSYLDKLDSYKEAPCTYLKVLPEDILCVESGNQYNKGMLVCSQTVGRGTGKDDVSMCTLTVTEFVEDGMLSKCEIGHSFKIKIENKKITDLVSP